MPSFSIAAASARMPRPEVFSERKSSSMMTMREAELHRRSCLRGAPPERRGLYARAPARAVPFAAGGLRWTIRATSSATAATCRTPTGRAAPASPCSSSSTTRKAARTACCTATPASEQFLSEIIGAAAYPARHLSMESIYEYGSRAGVWRILREFERRRLPLTVFGVSMALERNPDAHRRVRRRSATRSPVTAGAGSTTRTSTRRPSASTCGSASTSSGG